MVVNEKTVPLTLVASGKNASYNGSQNATLQIAKKVIGVLPFAPSSGIEL